jgi:hypothetical protein
MNTIETSEHAQRRVNRRERSGNALVEICLVMPWIFLLFIATFDYGFYLYAAISTANAARVAALNASNGAGPASDSREACLLVVEELRRLPAMAGVACPAACPAGGECTAGPVRVRAVEVTDTASADGAAPATQVSVTYTTIPLFELPWLPGQWTITRTVQARQRT